MQRDLRDTSLYAEIESYVTAWLKPGTGAIREATDLAVSPDGQRVAFSGTVSEKLVGAPATRICVVDLSSGQLQVMSFGPNTDRLPKWSPDGTQLAFLSDRAAPGHFWVYLLDLLTGEARSLPRPNGWVEYFHWRSDGCALLLGTAGLGADLAGAQGGTATKRDSDGLPSWMPEIESGEEEHRWRALQLLDLERGAVEPISPQGLNPWEACWAKDEIVSIASDAPYEGAWYCASLHLIDSRSGTRRVLYQPRYQIGDLSASPDGKTIAVVEATSSDRGLVAGELLLIDRTSEVRRCQTHGVDVTFTSFASNTQLWYAGHRSFQTVVGACDIRTGECREIWASSDCTIGNRIYPDLAPVPGRALVFACVTIGFTEAPAIRVCDGGEWRMVRSFESGESASLVTGISVERVTWQAPDGLEIHGWLLSPDRSGPLPVVMEIHGGPVWTYRPAYLGATTYRLALLRRGYALFMPNPRGSSGRGQDFIRRVLGDAGGADRSDVLSGLDHLTQRGFCDPARIGVMGGSYGGYMSAWLITQDTRFAAAVAVAPVTDWVSEHLTCHIPAFCEHILDDSMTNPGGRYFKRSPVMYADRVRTPTLAVCGALDRITPPGQAMEFYHALRLHNVESTLVTYPEEGHGVRKHPAAIDHAARVVAWFERWMPPERGP